MLNCHDSVHNKYLEGKYVLVEWEGKVVAKREVGKGLREGGIHILPRGQYIYWVEQHSASKTIWKDQTTPEVRPRNVLLPYLLYSNKSDFLI